MSNHPCSRESSPQPAPLARPWRCRSCNALLGVEREGELHVKYGEVHHWIVGLCRHRCRRCGTMNTHVARGSATPEAR